VYHIVRAISVYVLDYIAYTYVYTLGVHACMCNPMQVRAHTHTQHTHTHIHHAHAHAHTRKPDTLKLVVAEEDAPEAIAFVLKKDSPEAHIPQKYSQLGSLHRVYQLNSRP
jgi:hypothetical protein